MKKLLIILCAVAVLLCTAGCAAGETNKQSASSEPTKEDASSESLENAIQYDENTPLFVCQDRSDIEGDRDAIYYYNYKGDLLDSSASAQVGFYSKNGLAPARDPATDLIGFVNKSGVFVIEPQWNDAAAFSDDGIALVILKDAQTYNKKYGFINDKGEEIVPCIYDEATSFYPKGLAIIATAEKSEEAREYNGEAYVETIRHYKYGVLDKKGKVIIAPQYDSIEHIVGDYIVCKGENCEIIYDLAGKILFTQNTSGSDSSTYYTYWVSEETLIRYTWEKNNDSHTNTKIEVFDGEKFYVPNNISTIRVESRRVATTSTGYGFGIVRGEDVVVPFEYDNIIQSNSFFVAIKYNNGDEKNQTIDIYDENFTKTAESLAYNYYLYRTDPYGVNIALPSGYFDVYVYNKEVDTYVHGIIDHTGQIIVPLLYYRGIHLYTYEGSGGKFIH